MHTKQEKAKWQSAEAGIFNSNIHLLPLPSDTQSKWTMVTAFWGSSDVVASFYDSWAKTLLLMQKSGLSGTSWFSEFRILYFQTDSGKDATRDYRSESQESRGPSLSSTSSVTWGTLLTIPGAHLLQV